MRSTAALQFHCAFSRGCPRLRREGGGGSGGGWGGGAEAGAGGEGGGSSRIIAATMALSTGTRLGPYRDPGGRSAQAGWARCMRARHEARSGCRDQGSAGGRQRPPGQRLPASSERRVLSRALSHPNILAIHDFGTADGVSYAVMELLEGESMRQTLADGPLPPPRAVDYAIQSRVDSRRRTTRASFIATSNRRSLHHRGRPRQDSRFWSRSQDLAPGHRGDGSAHAQQPDRAWCDRGPVGTWRPSKCVARRRFRAPTSSRSARCSSKW